MKLITITPGLVFFFLTSCQESLNHYQLIGKNTITKEEISSGIYQAALRPVNAHLAGKIPYGMVKIHIINETMQVASWIDDSASVRHQQFIFKGTSCPTRKDDQNQDGVIDLEEALMKTEKIFIPLDSNLNNEAIDRWDQSVADFSYFQEASLSKKKLPSLDGKVVMILGVSPRQGIKSASVPVVCGVLSKVEEEAFN